MSKPTMAECGTCNRITYQTTIGNRYNPTPPVMLVCRGCGSLNYFDKGKLIKTTPPSALIDKDKRHDQ